MQRKRYNAQPTKKNRRAWAAGARTGRLRGPAPFAMIRATDGARSESFGIASKSSHLRKAEPPMDEILNRIAAETGLSTESARQAIGHVLAYMEAEGTDPAVGTMLDATPGAKEAIASAGDAGGGGIMGLGSKLMGLGFDMGQIRMVAMELVAFAKAHAGADTVDRVIATTPGLAQFA